MQFDVTTPDGYILDLWHVWDPEAVPLLSEDGKQKTVFMQHGFIDVAGTWFYTQESVAYKLAKDGYDIWLGNNRGTINSYLHVNLTVKDAEYWDYSFDEMGRYDLPSNIDFVLNKTGV